MQMLTFFVSMQGILWVGAEVEVSCQYLGVCIVLV